MTLRKGVDDEVPDMEGPEGFDIPEIEARDNPPATHSFLSFDWKEAPDLEKLQKALKPLGIFVYEDPTYEGADAYGYLFCKQELTTAEIKELCGWDDEMEEIRGDEELDPEDVRGPEPGE